MMHMVNRLFVGHLVPNMKKLKRPKVPEQPSTHHANGTEWSQEEMEVRMSKFNETLKTWASLLRVLFYYYLYLIIL